MGLRSIQVAGTQLALRTPANQPDAVSGTDQPIPLPAGRYTNLVMLGIGVEGNRAAQVITVTYTDGSIEQFVQSFSDWYTPQHFTGELEAVEMPHHDAALRKSATVPAGSAVR